MMTAVLMLTERETVIVFVSRRGVHLVVPNETPNLVRQYLDDWQLPDSAILAAVRTMNSAQMG
jgi:hypothetical protein